MALLAGMVAASFVVRPDFTRNFGAHPALLIAPIVTLVAAVALMLFRMRNDDLRTFVEKHRVTEAVPR